MVRIYFLIVTMLILCSLQPPKIKFPVNKDRLSAFIIETGLPPKGASCLKDTGLKLLGWLVTLGESQPDLLKQ